MGQGERISTKVNPAPARLQFQRLAHGPARLHDVLVVGERDPLDVDRSLERGKHLGHVQREAFVHRPPSPGRSRAALADQRGGRHLPAGHAIDRVVDEEDADLFSAIGGVDDFRGADRGQVSVALIGDHDLVGTGALQASRGGRSAAVRDLHVAHVEIVVGEDRAADGADQDGVDPARLNLRALRR